MKRLLYPLVLSFIILCSCTEDEETPQVEDPAIIRSIFDNGITIDAMALDYARMFRSTDGFPAIAPARIDQFIDKDEILVYFDFISHSRDSLYRYIENRSREYYEQGIAVDYAIKYKDKLESITVEVKRNNEDFMEFEDNSEDIRLIPTPEINSQSTFAKYEWTIEEFTERYQNSSFPEFCVLSFTNKEEVSNTYIFRVTFKFNNQKEFSLNTGQIAF